MLKQGAKKQRVKEKKKIEKSEFVQAEAVESDEDGGYGIGLKGKGAEEDYESGDDQDVVVEGLLDDQKMDANTEAVDLVQEKFK
jgi:mediator of replication checkpoint protein 1